MMKTPNDINIRREALDTSRSYIIQAPAGSGKTELLTQRFLSLLAQSSKNPEEIIAITFTRKAAAEMRARIIDALQKAHANSETTNEHEKFTRSLAHKALKNDEKYQWHLLENPNRLRIFTIDSLCARIISASPLTAKIGGQTNIIDDANEIYKAASQDFLLSLEQQNYWAESLATLLLHLDNDHSKAERLFIEMLAKRDQWLSHIVIGNPREALEHTLSDIINEQLVKVFHEVEKINYQELLILIRYACNNLQDNDDNLDILTLRNATFLPEPSAKNVSSWQGIAKFLLTKENKWRKQITTKEGFPSASSSKNNAEKNTFQEMKNRMQLLLETLSNHEILRNELEKTLNLPPNHYSESQWQIISALVTVLPVLVAHLHLQFKEKNLVDHIEISLRALDALGSPDNPSDLALILDYKIQHLLIDEFQDTSLTQFELLKRLTAGWQQDDDGRTLFLVGDPMQSIYRFRKADVGLFLLIQETGIANIKLHPLKLTVNFRSQKNIIQWINNNFVNIFPNHQNISTGSITFHASESIKEEISDINAVNYHCFEKGNISAQSQRVVEIIQNAKNQNEKQTIAILVMARSHLYEIIPALKCNNITYRAIEIEPLYIQSIIQDLFALTSALLYLHDRIAWLAILRAPWCGLSLADLLIISDTEKEEAILQKLIQYQNLQLSEEGKIRVAKVLPILIHSINHRKKLSLREWIESTWLALGGPACIKHESELLDAQTYFKLLENQEKACDLPDLQAFKTKLEKIASSSHSNTDNPVEVMTIHKSKGLEFDIVILPSLDKQTRVDNHQLLLWQEIPKSNYESELLLAPIKNTEYDPIYDYLRMQENLKAKNELVRLLYVAATRAKNQLHILAHIEYDKDTKEILNPAKGSLLDLLWPHSAKDFLSNIYSKTVSNDVPDETFNLCRISLSWKNSFVNYTNYESEQNPDSIDDYKDNYKTLIFDDSFAKNVGTVMHRILLQLSKDNSNILSYEKSQDHIKQLLILYNTPLSQLKNALKKIQLMMHNLTTDNKARWILENHIDAQSEFSISTLVDDKLKIFVIDRTFIENKTRWIIDYKTTDFQGDDLQSFLQSEKQKHQQQLKNYAQLFEKQENLAIKLGLYFPLIPAWCEWEYK